MGSVIQEMEAGAPDFERIYPVHSGAGADRVLGSRPNDITGPATRRALPLPAHRGLGALRVLIDHQPFQFANLHSHEPTRVLDKVIGLAKFAKTFTVPTILEERGGHRVKGLRDAFPEQKPIDRTFINTGEDSRVVAAVKKTDRKKLISAEAHDMAIRRMRLVGATPITWMAVTSEWQARPGPRGQRQRARRRRR